MVISRRSVLGGIGQSATLGALAASLSTPLRAAQAAAAAPAVPQPVYCISRIYRQGEGITFDGDIFRDKQLPLMQKAYEKTADRIELRMPVVAEGATPPQIIGTVNIWFHDLKGFLDRNSASQKDLAAGMLEVTKAQAVEQVDQVVTTLGAERSAVPLDALCYSTYFPAREGATFDAKYFAETFYPKYVQLFGDALYRVEMSSHATPKPQVMHSVHVYIRDETAFDARSATAPPEMFAEAKEHTNITPLQSLTRLHALA